ncbi:hypothetical protein, partial [Mycobacterium tuberculosis]|uniref:hypothetical protein n=1 Tax=Mycobacterium tuberculosis TaxID=1773 RepID=UPI00254A8E74
KYRPVSASNQLNPSQINPQFTKVSRKLPSQISDGKNPSEHVSNLKIVNEDSSSFVNDAAEAISRLSVTSQVEDNNNSNIKIEEFR